MPEARAQMAWADWLNLTHADLASAGQQAELTAYLQQHLPGTPTLTATLDAFDCAGLQAQLAQALRRLPAGHVASEHGFHSVSLYFDLAPSWPQLQAALQHLLIDHADELLRIKGVVYLPDSSAAYAVHAVGGRLYPPVPLPVRLNQDDRSRLVLISLTEPKHLANILASQLLGYVSEKSVRFH